MAEEKYIDLIRCLRRNARNSTTNISSQTSIPVSTTHDRIKAVEKKFVKKYSAIVDFEKLGFLLRAKILISSNKKNKINDFVTNNKNINSAFLLNGSFNFLLDCVFKDETDFNLFKKELEILPVQSKQICLILDELKREEFLN